MPVRKFAWFGDKILFETDENGDKIVDYTWARDELISERRNGKTYTHYYDGQGNTVALTDEDGNVTDTFDYDAWGNVIERTGDTPTPFQWHGQQGYYWDEDLSRFHVRARPYEPASGRWTTQDPLLFVDGMNLYQYVGNNPINFVDPSGMNGEKSDTEKNVTLPKNPDGCSGFCFGTRNPDGGNITVDCKLTAFTPEANNSYLCPKPADVKSGCKMLTDRLTKVQSDKKQATEKGWGFNLCGDCECDYQNGTTYNKSIVKLKLTFDNTAIGESGTLYSCSYRVSGTMTVTVKDGSVILAGCKKPC